jgi:hypothetical protein
MISYFKRLCPEFFPHIRKKIVSGHHSARATSIDSHVQEGPALRAPVSTGSNITGEPTLQADAEASKVLLISPRGYNLLSAEDLHAILKHHCCW